MITAKRLRARAPAFGCATLAFIAGCASAAPRDSATPAPATNPPTTTTRPVVLGPLHLTAQQAVSPVYAQGVAYIPGGWIFSGTNSLSRTDAALHVVRTLAPAIPPA